MDQSFYFAHWMLGIAYKMKGSRQQAIAEFQKARERSYQDHANELSQLKFDPLLDNLRSDPRFTDLVRRVGL